MPKEPEPEKPKVQKIDNRVQLPGAIDDLRWDRERTGWAPCFEVTPTEAQLQEGTLMDHQTYLEARIDDKFFGGKWQYT